MCSIYLLVCVRATYIYTSFVKNDITLESQGKVNGFFEIYNLRISRACVAVAEGRESAVLLDF